MPLETVEEMPRSRAIMGVDLQPGIDKRADKPSPYGALVVGSVPSAQVAEIARFVVGLARRKGAQPDRCHQLESSKNRVFRSVRGGYWAVSERPIEANVGAGKTASRAGLVAQIEGS